MINIYKTRAAFLKNLNAATKNLLLYTAFIVLVIIQSAGESRGQTPVFTDDFNRAAISPGGSPLMTYTTANGSGNGTASINSSTMLDLRTPGAGMVAGNVFVYGTTNTFSSLFNTTLNSNVGIVEWTFNVRYVRTTAPSGLANTNYGWATILAGTSNAFHNAGNGYAVVYGNSGSPDPIRLVRYTNGLASGTLTNICTSGVDDIAAVNNYVSVRVKYNPITNEWSLYVRDDGASSWANPSSGVTAQKGSTTADNTYTSSTLPYFGFFYAHATTASQINRWDNYMLTVIASSSPDTQASNLVFSGIATSSCIAGWTNGNGYKRIVKINTTNSFTNPVDGIDPTANSVYSGSGEQVVYNGTGNSVSVSGLTSSTEYWFRVYEYNYGASYSPIYQTATATDNPKSATTLGASVAPTVTSPSVTTITNNSAVLGGNVTSDGGDAISERGTVWSTSSPVSITDNPLAEGGTTTGVFSHSRTSLPPKTQIFFAAYAINSVNTSISAESNFFTKADEPTSHPGLFAVTPTPGNYTSLDLSWTTATGADGYLIIQRLGASAPGTAPSDATGYTVGSTLGTGTIAAVILSGSATSQTISGLSPSTQYTFRIYAFGYDGANAQTFNYYTEPTWSTATGTTNTPPPTVYTWTGATDNVWSNAANWNPNRTTPAPNDILQFNTGGSVLVTGIPAQTIGQLSISNNSAVEFQSAAAVAITISGGTGLDFDLESGSSLIIGQAVNGITVSLATGTTGSVGGSISYSNAAHKITAADANALTFQNGSVFTAGTGFSSNAFGSSGTANSVVFANGSKYIYYAGSNPFALTAPASIVVWQTGSTYIHRATGNPSLGNRTYANFELDEATGTNFTSSTPLTIDNLTVTSGSWGMGIRAAFNIKGNINVASLAALNFNPSSTGTLVLNGSTEQSIGGTGSLTTNTFQDITVSSTAGGSVKLNRDLTANGLLTISSGTLTLASGASLITNGAVSGNVIVERTVSGWGDAVHGWHLLSSPVVSQIIDPAFTDPTPANYDFYKWDEVNGLWRTQKQPANGITGFIPGTGYLVAYMNSATRQFNGALNTSDVPVSGLTRSGGTYSGWNLLGNPFPCALKWNDGINWTVPADIAGTAKIWDEATAAYIDIAPGSFIPSMNGFMVEVLTGSPASMTLPLAARVHNSTPWYKNTENSILLVAIDKTSNTEQQCIIRVNDQATEGFDAKFDSHFLAGYAPQFYTRAGSESLSTNTLPNLENNRVIELEFVKNTNNEFSISLDTENMIPGLVAYLTDKKSGIVTDLTQNQEYTFNAEEGEDSNRFLLHFSTVGLNDPDRESNIVVYSGAGCIYVSTAKPTDADFVITNLMGQVVLNGQTMGKNITTVNTSALSDGLYVVTVISGGRYTSYKVLVKR